MYLDKLIIKRFGNVESLNLKFKKGLNIIDCQNKLEVVFAYCLVVGGDETRVVANKLLKADTEIVAELINDREKIIVVISNNSSEISVNGIATVRYKSIFTESFKRDTICFITCDNQQTNKFISPLDFSTILARYKDEDFCLTDDYIKSFGAKAFRTALNIYIHSLKAAPIKDDSSIYLCVDSDGKFNAVTRDGDKIEITQKDKAMFNYNCFLKNREFWQVVHRTKDINYPELPLCIANLEWDLDEGEKNSLIKKALKDCRQVLAL